MRSTVSRALVIGALVVGSLSAAPLAYADEAPQDAPGCTITYVQTVGGPYQAPGIPTVSYTPPATVTVDADEAVNFTVFLGVRVAFATYDYVICVA